MVPFSITSEEDDEVKHELKNVGKKYKFTIRDLLPDDAGLYQMDVEGVTVFSTEFKSMYKQAVTSTKIMYALPH